MKNKIPTPLLASLFICTMAFVSCSRETPQQPVAPIQKAEIPKLDAEQQRKEAAALKARDIALEIRSTNIRIEKAVDQRARANSSAHDAIETARAISGVKGKQLLDKVSADIIPLIAEREQYLLHQSLTNLVLWLEFKSALRAAGSNYRAAMPDPIECNAATDFRIRRLD